MYNFRVFIMSGIPGSGKSTYVSRKSHYDDIVISRDAIRFMLLKPEDEYFSKEQEVTKKFYDTIAYTVTHNPDNKNVYIDATHLNAKSRKTIFNILKPNKIRYGFAVIVIYMDTPFYICQQQNRQRTGRARVPEEAIESMFQHHTILAYSEDIIIDGIYIVNGDNETALYPDTMER